MSDRMSNADIEDVLSSIRRLVSDDLRPAAGAVATPQPAPVAARPAVPRLVLTSALRVSPEPPRVPVPEAADRAVDVPRDALADRLAELEVLMASQSPLFEDEIAPPDPSPLSVPTVPLVEAQGMAEAGVADPAPAQVPEAPYVHAEPEAESAPPERAESAFDSLEEPQDDPVLLQDEDVLRALIRDVLREELQGVMGERVTRNLRKLIRAEIARALTARGIA